MQLVVVTALAAVGHTARAHHASRQHTRLLRAAGFLAAASAGVQETPRPQHVSSQQQVCTTDTGTNSTHTHTPSNTAAQPHAIKGACRALSGRRSRFLVESNQRVVINSL
jgi:hypothetical protein